MRKTVKVLIVSVCFLLSVLLIFFSLRIKNHIVFNYESFLDFLKSDEGKLFCSEVCYDLGIGLFSALVFLIGVDALLDYTNASEVNEQLLFLKKKQIARQLMLNPQKCIEQLNEKGELYSVYLENQNLIGCQLSRINLEGVSFAHTNFENACFIEANLTSSNFSSCILTHAEFNNAILSFAIFTDSNISSEQLQTAYSLWRAILPNGKRYSGIFQLKGDLELAKEKGYDLSDENQRKVFYGI